VAVKNRLGQINRSLQNFALKNLKEIILPYWMDNAIDKKEGGILGEINSANEPVVGAPKGLILHSRVLWTFSACYKFLKDDRLKPLANEVYDYIVKKFHDNEYDGYYWKLSGEGNPLDPKKQTYAQAFTLYGLSEYYSISSDPVVLQKAKDLYYLMESRCLDKIHGGYHEAFMRNWTVIDDMRLSVKDLNADKTMNTHLHVLEAYTNLYRVWNDPRLIVSIQNLLDIFDKHFVNHSDYHLNLFYDTQWNILSDQISYGHDIEASWLLQESAEVIDDEQRIKIFKDLAVKMVNASLEGLNDNGSMIYEWHRGGKGEKDEGIEWWPQSESMVGLYNAFQTTGDLYFLETAMKMSEFVSKFFIKKESGEWHNRVTIEGIPIAGLPVAGFWKCPYHNSRMCLEIIRRTGILD
jgi:cellobiose epimerase